LSGFAKKACYFFSGSTGFAAGLQQGFFAMEIASLFD
jgi:hypothetical protein